MTDIKKALTQAIKDFISINEVLSDEYLREEATEWVYEHDEDIKDTLRESANLDDCFAEALADMKFWDIF